jgi:DDE superfamily endonuclease
MPPTDSLTSSDREEQAVERIKRILSLPLLPKPILITLLRKDLQSMRRFGRQSEPRKRTAILRRNPLESPFYIDYWLDEQRRYRSGSISSMRHFKRMFRMSHAALDDLYAFARAEEWFEDCYPDGRCDAAGRPGVPLILLMMGSLAVMGGLPYAALLPLTYISEESHRLFFKRFCKVGSNIMFKKWVHEPCTNDELKEASRPYTAAGFPGCIGSADGVRVRLWSCSYSLKHQNIGKEGYPVRTYQVTVGNNGKIHACTRGWPGKDPDVTISEGDPFFKRIQTDHLYRNFEWEYRDTDGQVHREKGAWLIVDNGYPDWTFLQCPPKSTMDDDEIRWGKMLESLRKDVERTFGILKQRFRIFKTGVTLQTFAIIDDAFHTACALHNYLLVRDECGIDLSVPVTQEGRIVARLYRPRDQPHFVGTVPTRSRARSPRYLARRKMLQEHFNYLFTHDAVFWPKVRRIGMVQRRLVPIDNVDDEINYDLDD